MGNHNILDIRHYLAGAALAALAACGGGGGGGDGGGSVAATATGIFKDSNVSGLSYVSGNRAGVTGPDGSFVYEVGRPVTFSVGKVTIGTAAGRSVLSPVDLVPGGTSSSPEVQNIVRFLMMLDVDGNPDNGIVISPAVRTIAATWTQVDFGTADLATALVSIMADAATADQTAHALPDAATARTHLEATFLCAYAGAFRGGFSGDDNGPFGVLIDATTGFVTGYAYSNTDQAIETLSGASAIEFDQSPAFVSGNTSTGTTFSGEFPTPNQISGVWQHAPTSSTGTFSGSRIGGVANAAYRFTGGYGGGDFGLFAFDVDGSDNITGVAYSVPDDELVPITGTVSGTSVSATVPNGTVVSGTLDKATGALSGSWTNSTLGQSGVYSGSGCKLN